jgi:hypothetical protein
MQTAHSFQRSSVASPESTRTTGTAVANGPREKGDCNDFDDNGNENAPSGYGAARP